MDITNAFSFKKEAIDNTHNRLHIQYGSSPCLARAGSKVFMAWKASGKDGGSDDPIGYSNIGYSFYDTVQRDFSPQTRATGADGHAFSLQGSPAAAMCGQFILMVWNGSGGDGIWYSIYNTLDGLWTPQQKAGANGTVFSTQGVQCSPCLTVVGNHLFMAWNGSGKDGIWYSIFDMDRREWSGQEKAAGGAFGILGKSSPAAVAVGAKVMMAWSGSGKDGIWYSTFNIQSRNWEPQRKAVGKNGASFSLRGECGPAMAATGDNVFMTWTGSGNDGTYHAVYNANTAEWESQHQAKDQMGMLFIQETNPSITAVDDLILMTWKEEKSTKIWYTCTIGLPAAQPDISPSDWMGVLADSNPNGFAHKGLNRIMMPGTHDSAMYTTLSLGFFGKCQDHSIYEQLMGGVRYFDLRPVKTVDSSGVQYYAFLHGYSLILGGSLDDVLEDIKKFMNRPSCKETVILKFSHYEHFNNAQYSEFTGIICDKLKPWLFENNTNKRLAEIPIKDLQKKVIICSDGYADQPSLKQKGVFYYRGVTGDEVHADMAKGDICMYDSYSDKTDMEKMKSDQTNKFTNYNGFSPDNNHLSDKCDLFVLSWTLTPATGVYFYAMIANRELPAALNAMKIPNKHGMVPNIIYLDYYNTSLVTKICCAYNAALR